VTTADIIALVAGAVHYHSFIHRGHVQNAHKTHGEIGDKDILFRVSRETTARASRLDTLLFTV